MSYTIVQATDSLLAEIESWLDAEETAYDAALNRWYAEGYEGPKPVRGFRCNWDSSVKRWRDGLGPIDVLIVDAQAVGFLVGTDILEIRPDVRGNGYGRVLAQFMLDRLYDEGHSVAEIGIAPDSAKPFWIAMGFTPIERPDRGAEIYAYKLLPRNFEMGQGVRVIYSIAFYTEEGRYAETPRPFASFGGEGELLPDGSLKLPKRIVCLDPTIAGHVDYFARIEMGGREVLFSKVNYDDAVAAGVQRDTGYNYYIDVIRDRSVTRL